AGGTTYGYRREDGEERVVPAQAEVIRRVFEEIAAGRGLATVAKRLAAEGVPSPRRGWSMSGVRAIVGRELYRGRLTWGTTRWLHKSTGRVKQTRPEPEVDREVPALRIIDDDLWAAAHERLAATRTAYLAATGGRRFGRPPSGVEGRYLLTGFVACAECLGGMHVAQRRYLCTAHRQRGATACGNRLGAPLDALHADVVETIRRDVLAPDLVRDVLARALDLWASDGDEGARAQLGREAARLEGVGG